MEQPTVPRGKSASKTISSSPIDCVPRPNIDRNAWLYPPVAADPLAVPPIAAFAGRLKYPLGADGYPTEESDVKIQKDQETLDKARLQESSDNEKCMQRILLTLPHILQEEIQEKDPDFNQFTSNYQVFSLIMCIREALTLSLSQQCYRSHPSCDESNLPNRFVNISHS